MLLTSNPFERVFPVPADGRDLNPLLQDPGMVAHPPMLYTGYVGFSVAFAFAIAALMGGRLDATWARWSRPCLACHANVNGLYGSGKHKSLGCNTCHDGTAEHLADAKKHPATKTDLATCGGCHANQYNSYSQMDWQRTGRFEKKQLSGPAPDPAYDLLMTPHGFTREHNLPRSHTFALLDQYVVDRAFGGRFGTKEGWRYLAGTGDFNVMDVVIDQFPDNTDQKAFKPGTAAAANPVCLSCKTQDHILDWAYM